MHFRTGIQNLEDPDDYFGNNSAREENLKGIRLERIPLPGELMLFKERTYRVEQVITELETATVTLIVKQVGK